MSVPYAKVPCPIPDQLQLLISRGLVVADRPAAEAFLSRVSYYRFSGYVLPFESVRHAFRPGVTFEDVQRLYQMDEALRQAIFAALSPVEVLLRARVTNVMALHQGAFAQHDGTIFRSTFDHGKWCQDLEKETDRAKETFVEHFKAQYQEYPRLPIWAAAEVMSFGTLSFLYKGLLEQIQANVAGGLVHHRVLHNWFHFLTYLRNACAHHTRLWNRELPIRPDVLRKEWKAQPLDNTHAFIGVAVLEWLTRRGGLDLGKVQDAYAVLDGIRKSFPAFETAMGIPAGWDGGMLWK